MKQHLCLLWIVIGGCTTAPSTTTLNQKVDQKHGYKDLILDQPMSVIEKRCQLYLEKVSISLGSQTYKVPTTRYLSIGSVSFDRLDLTFIDDTLGSIRLLKKDVDKESATRLVEIYSREFGQPVESTHQSIKNGETLYHSWDGYKGGILIAEHNDASVIVCYTSNQERRREAEHVRRFEEYEKRSKEDQLKEAKGQL